MNPLDTLTVIARSAGDCTITLRGTAGNTAVVHTRTQFVTIPPYKCKSDNGGIYEVDQVLQFVTPPPTVQLNSGDGGAWDAQATLVDSGVDAQDAGKDAFVRCE